MNKQELIEKLKGLRDGYPVDESHEGVRQGLLIAIGMIGQLLEPTEAESVIVPKFVADWYEKNENDLEYGIYLISNHISSKGYGELNEMEVWFNSNLNKPIETLIRMKLFGYEVGRGKQYQVIIPTKDKLWKYYYLDDDGGINMTNKLEHVESHTEEFIRSVSDDLWQFAVEVTEENK